MSSDFSATPGDPLCEDSLKMRIQHQIKASIDSVYSQVMSDSFSMSSSSKISSLDSEDVEKIAKKTEKIKEMVTARLTAFAFMSKQSCETENFEIGNSELEKLRKSLDCTLNECIVSEDKTNEVLVKTILESISELQKEFVRLQYRLMETQAEIRTTEEEEAELKSHMSKVEGNVSRFIIETKNENTSCKCDLM